MLKTRDPFQNKRRAGCLIQKEQHAWVPQASQEAMRAAGGLGGVPVLHLAATGRSRVLLPVTWVLWLEWEAPTPDISKQLSQQHP